MALVQKPKHVALFL